MDNLTKGDIWKSAIAEYQWDQQHQDGTRVLGRATRPIQLKVKEVLHIERTALTPGWGLQVTRLLGHYHEEARLG